MENIASKDPALPALITANQPSWNSTANPRPADANAEPFSLPHPGAGPGHPEIERAAQLAHEAVDKAASAAAPAAGWISEKSRGARVAKTRLVGEARGYVSAHPMTGTGIALAVGLVIGLIL